MNKKDNILQAALKLLTSNGLHATPMSAIAKEAGTGMGTIYNYYPTKEVLINEIYVVIKQQEMALFDHFNSELPTKTQFETYFEKTVGFFLQNPLYFKFMEQLHASPIITNDSRTVGRNAVESVVQLIDSGKKDRIIKNIDTSEILQFVGGAILSYLRWYLSDNNNQGNSRSLENLTNMVWDAIKE